MSKSLFLALSFLIVKWNSRTRYQYILMSTVLYFYDKFLGRRSFNVSMEFIVAAPTLKELMDHPWGVK